MNRNKILELVKEYYKDEYSKKEFIEGKSLVPVSGRVFDEDDMLTLVDSALDFHLTTYKYNEEFEKGLRDFFGLKYALTCNSGSSANLIAVTSLTSHLLKDRALKNGDEVICMVNGMGATPLMELYLFYNSVENIAEKKGLKIVRNLVGNYVTSIDMAGVSISMIRVNEEILQLWDYPVHTAALRWGM